MVDRAIGFVIAVIITSLVVWSVPTMLQGVILVATGVLLYTVGRAEELP